MQNIRLALRSQRNCYKLLTAILLVLASSASWASVGIAVLDFELKDLTLLPNSPQERKRTASIAPLLRQTIDLKKKYRLVAIDPSAQKTADAGFGYLFDHPEEAARLGQQHSADYVAVGRLHKPSFLFVYLLVHLVDVKKQRLAGDYVVEIKGDLEELTRRGVAHLADQIDTTLKATVPK